VSRLFRLAVSAIAVAVMGVLAVPALAGSEVAEASTGKADRVLTATFDSLEEGLTNTSLTDGGITFFGLDQRLPDSAAGSFTIDRADGTLFGLQEFTPPNALGFGGFVPGPDAAFGRVGEFRISPKRSARQAQLELFDAGVTAGNLVTLEALRHGEIVATDSVTLLGGGIQHYTLSIVGPKFDELRIVGSGDIDNGVFFGLVDSVTVTLIRPKA
jgi:hypothetical protein